MLSLKNGQPAGWKERSGPVKGPALVFIKFLCFAICYMYVDLESLFPFDVGFDIWKVMLDFTIGFAQQTVYFTSMWSSCGSSVHISVSYRQHTK